MAVSGGQDSLCLAQLLLDLQPKWGWKLAIAHCDHRWRSDSAANAEFVQGWAESLHLPYFSATANSPPASEAAAREWRYQVMGEIAQDNHYPSIATGHTASDRAETLLYNLIRGSGADGLQALAWQRSLSADLKIVRPLLSLTRTQTGEFCGSRQLTIWQDSTNQDLHYARNRIRLDLLPYLQTHLNPNVEKAIAQTAELLQAEVEYLESEARRIAVQVVERKEQGLFIDRHPLKTLPLALQRRVLRQLLQEVLASAPNFEHVEKLITLLVAPNRTQTDPFPGGAIACVEGDFIYLKKSLSEKKYLKPNPMDSPEPFA
jgi:tRNA(Ile)-lysidine synthase